MIILTVVLCFGLREMGCGPAARPVACVEIGGKRTEVFGNKFDAFRKPCFSPVCQVWFYNQGVTGEEFEKEREVCHPHICDGNDCKPIS